MNTLFWLRRVGLMLWLETIADRRRFAVRTVVFAIFAVMFWLLFSASMVAISQANQSLVGVYSRMAEAKAHENGGQPIKVPMFDKKYSVSEETGALLLKLIGSKNNEYNIDPNNSRRSPLTIEDRLNNAADDAEHSLKKFEKSPRLQIYTNNPKLWPSTVRTQVEKMFGPLHEADEETYLNRIQKKGNAWVGVRENEGQLQWRGWGPESFWKTNSETQTRVLREYINAVGDVYQANYLDNIKSGQEYQALPYWNVAVLPTFTPIDLRALSLFLILAVFVFPTLLAASQAITWDFNRNKNVYEPYATMKIPVWGVLLKESLSGFWYLVGWAVITALLCGLVVSANPSYWGLLMGMIALGLSGCWLNLQINMFLVVTFQTPVGRQLARVLVMPFFFLPYHLFRVFGATEILQILDGKSLDQFNWIWMWGATAVCFVLGVAVLRLAAWRVGRYRKGLAPS